jgi:hypothetical protein
MSRHIASRPHHVLNQSSLISHLVAGHRELSGLNALIWPEIRCIIALVGHIEARETER